MRRWWFAADAVIAQAFEELVRRTARLVFAHLYVKTRDVHKTEDLVQETYLCAWRSIADVDNPATFRAWLTTIANSVFVDSGRRNLRKKRKQHTPRQRRRSIGRARSESIPRGTSGDG